MSDLGETVSEKGDGKSLYKAGQYAEAIPLLKESLAANPSDASARAYLAACYAQVGNNAAAIDQFARLVELAPSDPQHCLNLGVAYETAGDRDKAMAAYEKALALNPDYARAQRRLNALRAKARINATPPPTTSAPPRSADTVITPMAPPRAAPSTEAPRAPQAPPSPPAPSARPIPMTAPQGLNWGAFLLPFFWSIAHKAWLWAVVSFFLPLVGGIVLLITGNKVAVEKREFATMDDFKKVQKAWTIWGLAIVAIWVVLGIALWVSIFAKLFSATRQVTNQITVPSLPQGRPQTFIPGQTPGVPALPSLPPSDIAVEVKPYPGAKPQGSPINGRDAEGSFTMTSYTSAASLAAVQQYFKDLGRKARNYSTFSSDQSADIAISPKGGKVKVHIESRGPNTTDFTIQKYGGK